MSTRLFSPSLIVLCAFFVISSGFCCDSLTALADLTIKALNRPSEITVGEIFDVTADAFNIPSEEKCDAKTLGAGINKFLMRILKSNGDPNSDNWPAVYENSNYDVPPIDADELEQLLFALQVNEAGNYKYQGYIDYRDDIEERNEDNNGGIYKNGQVDQRSNNFASFIFTVEGTSDGVQKMDGPIVQVISYTTHKK